RRGEKDSRVRCVLRNRGGGGGDQDGGDREQRDKKSVHRLHLQPEPTPPDCLSPASASQNTGVRNGGAMRVRLRYAEFSPPGDHWTELAEHCGVTPRAVRSAGQFGTRNCKRSTGRAFAATRGRRDESSPGGPRCGCLRGDAPLPPKGRADQ